MNSSLEKSTTSESKVRYQHSKPVAAFSDKEPAAPSRHTDPSSAAQAGRYPVPFSSEGRYATRGRH